MTNKDIIAAAYDVGVNEEYNRLVSNPLFEAEFELITELMKKYIAAGSTVIDIGAGPGRYAEFLLKMGCMVGLVDLSIRSLEAFEKRVDKGLKSNVLFSKVACATDLSFIEKNCADAVFLMGPLYHLTDCEERTKAISEAFRVLKKGGFLFAVFLSTYGHPPHHHDSNTPCCSDYVKHLLKDAITTVKFQKYMVPQYKCLPEVAINSIEPHGFDTMHIRNLEGIGLNYSKNDLSKYDSQTNKNMLFDELRSTCEDPEMIGLANQFLYVGRKDVG